MSRTTTTLAEIDPGYEWSSPTLGNRTIQSILRGIESGDGSMRDFLEDEKQQWTWQVREYGATVPAVDGEQDG